MVLVVSSVVSLVIVSGVDDGRSVVDAGELVVPGAVVSCTVDGRVVVVAEVVVVEVIMGEGVTEFGGASSRR